MADKKISALPAASTPLAGTEVLPIVQSGATDQVSVANLTAGRDVSGLSFTGGNLKISANTFASTNTNGNIIVSPNGSGLVGINMTPVSNSGKLQVQGLNTTTSTGGIATATLYDGDANNEYCILAFATNAGGGIARLAAKATTTGAYPSSVGQLEFVVQNGGGATTVATMTATGSLLLPWSGGCLGYSTGSGGAVTQATSRTTGVTLNKSNGAITLFSAAGTTSWQTFTVTNSTVAATDTIIVSQQSGADLYQIFVTNVAAGSFKISFATTGGTTTEQPVFNFAVIKAVAA